MILPGIFSVRISLGVVDVLSRQIAAKTFGRDFKFLGNVSMSQEATACQLLFDVDKHSQDHDDIDDGLQVGLAQTSDIDSLVDQNHVWAHSLPPSPDCSLGAWLSASISL